MTIRKTAIISVVALCAVSAIITISVILILNNVNVNKSSKNFKSNELKKYKEEMKNYVEIAYRIISYNYDNTKNKSQENITIAKENTKNEIRNLIYNNGTGYFWINSTDEPYPIMILHPTIPELEGTILDSKDFNCLINESSIEKNLFQEFVRICNDSESGFVEYLWPKPTEKGLTKKQPKLSYVRIFKEWNWIVGSGRYIDEIDLAIKDQKNIMFKNNFEYILYISISLLIILVIAIIVSYFTISSKIIKPVDEIIEYLRDISNGNLNTKNKIKISGVYEFAIIKRHIQETVFEISDIILKINDKSIDVYQSSVESKKHIDELKSDLGEISSTTQELSASVQETAATTEEMNTITEEIRKLASQIVSDLNKFELQNGNVDIKELYDSIEELYISINNMVKGIGEVAIVNTQNAVGTSEIAKSVSDVLYKAEEVAKHSKKMKKTAFDFIEILNIFSS